MRELIIRIGSTGIVHNTGNVHEMINPSKYDNKGSYGIIISSKKVCCIERLLGEGGFSGVDRKLIHFLRDQEANNGPKN